MAISVEREDREKSFVTTLRFINGNEAQEISVYTWEADAIQAKIQSMPIEAVLALYNKTGKQTIKTWE
jgi:hypothetical protein